LRRHSPFYPATAHQNSPLPKLDEPSNLGGMREAWTEIEKLARELGASEWAIYKWRTRGVPLHWRLRFLEDSRANHIPREAFDSPPNKRVEAA
jgi:hypothetical protein